jgi:hypothetical protein
MNPFAAVQQAGNCVRLAEYATNRAERERHLKLAKLWLERADVEAWFQHKRMPAVIIAREENDDE